MLSGPVMPRSIRILHARDFICAKPDGVIDLEESEQVLREVVGASKSLEDFDILVDTRDASSTLSAGDLWYLAERLARYPKTFAGKTAILCPNERFDHARFFALCAENKDIDMRAFTSYEDAMKWLGGERSERR
jgi:hypothetical protein